MAPLPLGLIGRLIHEATGRFQLATKGRGRFIFPNIIRTGAVGNSFTFRYETQRGKTASTGNTTYERFPNDTFKDEDVVTSEILQAALNYVNTKGWTVESISAGAKDVYLSEGISGMFSEYDLVKFFFATCNSDLEKHLASTQPVPSIYDALAYRLQLVIPYTPNLQEALALATKPTHVPESFRHLLNMADSVVHHSLKDTSTDVSWYTKRVGIASIYVATELCLVQDTSEGYRKTFDFLARRVKDYEAFGCGSDFSGLPLTDVMSVGYTTMRNILRRNVQR